MLIMNGEVLINKVKKFSNYLKVSGSLIRQQTLYVKMFLLRYFYLLFTCIHVSASHLLRQTRARSAVFHMVFKYKDTKLNIAPIKTITGVPLEEDCCNHCLATHGCLSVNYERERTKRCELLPEDRDTRNETDFVSERYFRYYDTIVRDLCNEKDSCYPCSCWSAEFYRSPCICRKLHGKMIPHSPAWVTFIAINIYELTFFGVDQEGRIVASPATHPSNGTYVVVTNHDVQDIKYSKDNKIHARGFGGVIHTWSSGWNTENLSGASFDYTDEHILVIHLTTFELYLKPISDGSLTKVAMGAISRVQEYGKYWYAIGKDCKCIMRHETTPSPTVNKWEMLTTNPGSSIEFKVAFNDIIYSLHEDQKIYEWYGNEDRWVMIYQGPCIHFDVHHLIFCVTPNHEVHSNYGEYVPRPNIHIPLKTLNHSSMTTPYGRGMDINGDTEIFLNMVDNNIALDQFGKGYVLQKGDGEDVQFGNFENTVLQFPFKSRLESRPTYFTLSLWFRATQQTFNERKSIICTFNQGGIGIVLDPVDETYAEIQAIVSGTADEVNVVKSKSKAFFFSWTHVVISWDLPKRCLKLFLNGIREATSCTGYSVTRTIGPSSLRSDIKSIYISDIAIWYALLLDQQIFQLYQSDNVAPGWRKKFNFTSVTESSCEQLRRQRPYITSGYYWIKLNGEMISVYCDMVTDGGGWTQITHLDNSLHANEIGEITQIGNVVLKNFVLTLNGLSALRQRVDFKQLRLRCSKPTDHGRTIDIATTTSSVLDYFTGATDERPYACGGFYPLEEDDSIMSQRCEEWKDGKFGHTVALDLSARFKNVLMVIPHTANFNWETNRCDDSSGGPGIYQYYVR